MGTETEGESGESSGGEYLGLDGRRHIVRGSRRGSTRTGRGRIGRGTRSRGRGALHTGTNDTGNGYHTHAGEGEDGRSGGRDGTTAQQQQQPPATAGSNHNSTATPEAQAQHGASSSSRAPSEPTEATPPTSQLPAATASQTVPTQPNVSQTTRSGTQLGPHGRDQPAGAPPPARTTTSEQETAVATSNATNNGAQTAPTNDEAEVTVGTIVRIARGCQRQQQDPIYRMEGEDVRMVTAVGDNLPIPPASELHATRTHMYHIPERVDVRHEPSEEEEAELPRATREFRPKPPDCIRVATWNVGGLDSHAIEVAQQLHDTGIDIVALTELKDCTHVADSEALRGWTLHTGNVVATRTKQYVYTGLMVRANSGLTAGVLHSGSRHMWLHIRSTVAEFNVCVFYGNASSSLTAYKESLAPVLDTWEHALTDPQRTLVLGDFNARLHLEDPDSGYVLQATNEKGRLLQQTLDALELAASVQLRPFSSGAAITYSRRPNEPDATSSAIDYVLVTPAMADQLVSREVIETNLQHNIVCVDVKHQGLLAQPRRQPKLVWDFRTTKLANDVDWTQYTSELGTALAPIAAAFEPFVTQTACNGHTDQVRRLLANLYHDAVRDTVLNTAARTLSYKVITNDPKPFWNEDLDRLNKRMLASRARWNGSQQPADRNTYNADRKAYRKALEQAKVETTRKRAAEVHRLGLSSKEAWRRINPATHDSGIPILTEPGRTQANGEPMCTSTARGAADVFCSVYADIAQQEPDVGPTAQILAQLRTVFVANYDNSHTINQHEDVEFDEAEVEEVRRKLQKFKAPGPGGVYGELIKIHDCPPRRRGESDAQFRERRLEQRGREFLVTQSLTHFYNALFRLETTPEAWETAWMRPIKKPNAGAATDPMAYRAVALMPTLAKTFDALLTKRLHDFIARTNVPGNGPVEDTAAGGLPETRLEDLILMLTEAINEQEAKGEPIIICSLDVARAFQSTDHSCLWSRLGIAGVKDRLFRVMRAMYDGAKALVSVGEAQSDEFELR